MIETEVRELLSFIDGNPTAYHTTASVREILLKAGFSELLESAPARVHRPSGACKVPSSRCP